METSRAGLSACKKIQLKAENWELAVDRNKHPRMTGMHNNWKKFKETGGRVCAFKQLAKKGKFIFVCVWGLGKCLKVFFKQSENDILL